MDNLALAVVWYVVLLVSFVFHEAAHGLAALKLGDPTAYLHGQVTLDPVPHIKREPFGMVVIPILSYLFAGWMIGWASAPYDPYWAQTHRRKAALMALAGPAANLTLVLAAALIIRAGMLWGLFHAPESITFTKVAAADTPGFANAAAVVVSILFSLNLILLVFNLIPLPPLDGSNILSLALSERAAERYNTLLRQPGFRIIGLVVAWQVLGFALGPIHTLALNILYPGAGYH
ncbi:MAG TPA: site-2 protease family protein [Sedimentisphaerales bacterium]|nr:site-2 protease family protein [Sedimentisphaerales bacterium]